MNEIALAHPGVALKLLSNKEEIINCEAHADLLQRIEILFGSELAKVLIPISFDIAPLKIRGFISRPGFGKANRQGQYIFVNKRPVADKIITHAVSQGYYTCLMEKQFPCVFIFIETLPELVDVNVHPSKREVRFREASVIHDVLMKLIKDALTDKSNLPGINKAPAAIERYSWKDDFSKDDVKRISCENNAEGVREFFAASSEFNADLQAEQGLPRSFLRAKYLQIDNTYIAVQDKNGMIIIDAHAAHERILFDQLKAQFNNKKVEKQKLLFPLTLHFNKDEFMKVLEIKSVFDALGFEIEDFGDSTMALYAYPAVLGKVDIAREFKNMIADILELDIDININMEKSITPILSTIACHCAIRAGQALTDETIAVLINDLWRTSSPYTCPHGRPTIISLTRDELEKRFKRK